MTEDEEVQHLEGIADSIGARRLPLDAAVRILIFLAGEALAQASDEKFDEQVCAEACQSLAGAYRINCGSPAPQTANIVH